MPSNNIALLLERYSRHGGISVRTPRLEAVDEEGHVGEQNLDVVTEFSRPLGT
jgi:hypothetical protein